MSVFATEYKKMQVPASEVRGKYVNDDPYQEEDIGPEHTADLIIWPNGKWTRVVGVVPTEDRSAVYLELDGHDPRFKMDSWAPVDILRPVHRPPFDAGLSGYHR